MFENKTSLLLALAVGVIALLLLPTAYNAGKNAALRQGQAKEQPAESPAPAPAQAPAPEPEAPPRAPLPPEILDKLLYGMTYAQVVEKTGCEADETESEYDWGEAGYTSPTLTVWRTWKNPDGSLLKVGFVDEKLDQKRFVTRDQPEEEQ